MEALMHQGLWGVRPFSRRGCSTPAVLLVAAILAIFATPAIAQETEPTPETNYEATPTPTAVSRWTLTGTVVNAMNGTPLRRVLLQAEGSAEGSTLTDAEGHFQFTELPEGSPVSLTVRK